MQSFLLIINFKKVLDTGYKIIYNVLVANVTKLNIYGELAERSKAAVLKTVDVRASWGSNP